MKVLTIDLGATSGRLMIVSLINAQIQYEEIHRFDNIILNENEELRWDFSNIMKNVRLGLKKAFTMHKDIASIGIDTWGVDYGIIDKNGNLLANPRCYRDMGTNKIIDEVLSKVSYEEIYQETGIQKLSFNTIFQLYLDQNILKNASKILLIPDLIAYFLTGSQRLELTNCSTTALYNPQEKKISDKLLKAIGVSKDIFAEMIYPGQTYGMLKSEYLTTGQKSIPVISVCSHDTASAVAATSVNRNCLFLSSGTWSLMGAELDLPVINEKSLALNFSNEIGINHSVRFLKNIMGMFMINEVRKDFKNQGHEIKINDIATLVNQVKENNTYLDPDDPMFMTPTNMVNKIGCYLKKTHQEQVLDAGSIMKMIYESMALKYRYVFTNISKFSGLKFDEIVVVGGGNQSNILNQYTANALGIKVRKGCIEATVVGNAIVQFIAHKQIKDVHEARKIVLNSIKEEVFNPEDNWDYKYQEFLEKTNLK